MFYRIITGEKALTAFVILVLAIINWLPAIFFHDSTTMYHSVDQMPLYQLILVIFNGQYLSTQFFAFLLLLILGILLVRINAKFILIQQRTFLPAFFLILLSGYLPENLKLSCTLIASLFLVFTLNTLLSSYKADPNSLSFFIAGLLLGVGSLFYAPLIYFLLFVWISLAILRNFYWREYIFPILGLLIPYAFYFAWMVIYDVKILEFLDVFKESLSGGFPALNFDLPHKIFGGYLILIILISSIYMMKVFKFRKIYLRNYFLVLFWLFFISIAVFALLSGFNTGMIYIILIPISYLLTNYFCTGRKSWENKTLLYLMILGEIFLVINREVEWTFSF